MDFNFDEWAELAKSDPAEFEERRQQTLRVAVEQAPARHRRKLEGTLFRIEANRAKAKNPLHHAILASQLMWASFEEMRASLNQVSGGRPRDPEQAARHSAERRSATITTFSQTPARK
jgi:Protein of unknown function (DUF3135)